MHPTDEISNTQPSTMRSTAGLDCNGISEGCGINLLQHPPTRIGALSPALSRRNIPRITDLDDELESLYHHKVVESSDNNGRNEKMIVNIFPKRRGFPPKLRLMLHLIDGNSQCVNCLLKEDPKLDNEESLKPISNQNNDRKIRGREIHPPMWALIKYGALVCGQCAFHHMTILGEEMGESVISLESGHWTLHDVLSMLEGGNKRLMNSYKERADRKVMNNSSGRSLASLSTSGRSVKMTDDNKRARLQQSTSVYALIKRSRRSKDLINRLSSRHLGNSSSNIVNSSINQKDTEFSSLNDHFLSRTAALYRKDLADRVESVVAIRCSDYHPEMPIKHKTQSRSQNGKSSSSPRSSRSLSTQSQISRTNSPIRLPKRRLSPVSKRGNAVSEKAKKAHESNRERSFHSIPVPLDCHDKYDLPRSVRNIRSTSTVPLEYNVHPLELLKGSPQEISGVTVGSLSARSMNRSSRSVLHSSSRSMCTGQNEAEYFSSDRYLSGGQRNKENMVSAETNRASDSDIQQKRSRKLSKRIFGKKWKTLKKSKKIWVSYIKSRLPGT
mmetsp:Transcript_14819/g.21646  ORF Transcript_14819/g.21646 Transcript_14819/m.21646 type:complete len:556 (+) Transcript_14819:109-1776(+)